MVEFIGPPFVATNAVVKTRSAPISPTTRLKKTVGESIGSVTLRNPCQALAPSISDASYSSVGTPCSPARKMIIVLPPIAPHRLMRMSPGLDQAGEPSQPGPTIPTAKSRLLSGPKLGLRIQIQRNT